MQILISRSPLILTKSNRTYHPSHPYIIHNSYISSAVARPHLGSMHTSFIHIIHIICIQPPNDGIIDDPALYVLTYICTLTTAQSSIARVIGYIPMQIIITCAPRSCAACAAWRSGTSASVRRPVRRPGRREREGPLAVACRRRSPSMRDAMGVPACQEGKGRCPMARLRFVRPPH